MLINVNDESFIPQKNIYERKELEGLENWSFKTSKIKGRTYEVYTKDISHSFGWKLMQGIKAIGATFFSLGLGLLRKDVRLLWWQAATGIEQRKIRVTPFDDDDKVNKTVFQNTLGSDSPIFTSPQNLAHPNSPQKLSSKYPSILTLKVEDSRLQQSADIKILKKDSSCFDVSRSNEILMQSTLTKWYGYTDNEIRQFTGLKDSDIHSLREKVQERVEAYNQVIQLEGRIEDSKHLSHIQNIQIQDIASSWEKSGLQIALRTDQEIADLTFEEMNRCSLRQKEILISRVEIVKGVNVPHMIDKEKLASLTLAQLRGFSSAVLDRVISSFDCEMLSLLMEEQCDNLNPLLLSDDQFIQLYSSERRVQNLVPPGLQESVIRIARLFGTPLRKLTPSQIQSLDFADPKLATKNILDVLADKYNWQDSGRGIRSLTPEQVIDCLNAGIFDSETSKYIVADQIKKMDFTQVNCKQAGGQDIFNVIFSKKENVEAISTKEQRHHLFPFIHPLLLDGFKR